MTVPILAVGNWSVWPTLPDLAWLAFGLLSVPYLAREKSANLGVLRVLLAVFLACAASYAILTVAWPVLHELGSDKGGSVGLYQLYRLSQFFIVFWLATKVTLPPSRVRILYWIALGACVFVSLSCLATYWFVPTSFFGGHLIGSVGRAGPWAPYILGVQHMGVGATNINHIYTGMQIMLLAALAAHLRRPSSLPPWLALLAFTSIFISEHRTGVVFFIIYVGLLIRPTARYVFSAAALVVVVGAIAAYTWTDTHQAFFDAIERHATITTSYSTDGFAARDQIWAERINFLNGDIGRWVVGSGFGSAMDSGANAHMLYLHIVIETGLLGLCVFLGVILKILSVLWRNEQSPHALFWVTLCLLGTGLTQETFYPVAAFGHFIGLFLCAVAISIRSMGYQRRAWMQNNPDPGSQDMIPSETEVGSLRIAHAIQS